MKTFLTLIASVFGFSLFATDTLFVATNKGNYFLDTRSGNFIPASGIPEGFVFSCDNSFFTSHEGISYSYDFTEQTKETITFEWWSLHFSTDSTSYELVNFDTKPPSSGYIMYPLFFSLDGRFLYFRSVNNDARDNEQGIFLYEFTTKQWRKLVSEGSYKHPPITNDARTKMYYLGFAEEGNVVVEYDLESHAEKILFRAPSIKLLGIHMNSFEAFAMTDCNVDENQPELRSPCMPGTSFCITRMGMDAVLTCDQACASTGGFCSPAPFCEGHCEDICTDCRDAVDLDVFLDYPPHTTILASADGYVLRAQTSCPVQGMGQGYGFGYHVVVRHGNENDGNAPETVYAHLSEVFVEEGEYVVAGQPIGRIGNSQVLDCNNDGVLDCDCESDDETHLHYEYHDGAGTLYSTTDIRMPVWIDIGDCVPQPNKSYQGGTQNFDSEVVYPSTSFEVFLDVDCGGDSYATVVGVSCACCESEWLLEGVSVPGDTIVVPLVDYLANNNNVIWLSRLVESPCVAITSYGETALNLNLIFADCVFGCTNSDACNFNPLANGDDGSCDFSCLVPCDVSDLNEDGIINVLDCTSLFQYFGMTGTPPIPGDLTGDGEVNLSDLLSLLQYFGQTCP